MTEERKSSRAPAYIAYQVRDNEQSGEAFWTRIGVAFAHADHKGFNLVLDAVPLVQEYIGGAIRHGIDLGEGHAPMNHFWRLY